MEVTISSSSIKVPAEIYRLQGALIGVEFNGIFFDESTGVSVKFIDMSNNIMQGTVLKVVNNRAIIKLYTLENALVWDMIYKTE